MNRPDNSMPSMADAYAELHPIAVKITEGGGGFRDVVDLTSTLMIFRWCQENQPTWTLRKIADEMGVSHQTLYRRQQRLVELTGWDFETAPVPDTAVQPPPRIAFGLG